MTKVSYPGVVVMKTNLELVKRIEKATKEKKTLSHILSKKMRLKDLSELPWIYRCSY